MSNKFLDLIKSSEAKWVDFRFTDTKGKEQHEAIQLTAWTKTFLKKVKCLMVHQSLVGKALKRQI